MKDVRFSFFSLSAAIAVFVGCLFIVFDDQLSSGIQALDSSKEKSITQATGLNKKTSGIREPLTSKDSKENNNNQEHDKQDDSLSSAKASQPTGADDSGDRRPRTLEESLARYESLPSNLPVYKEGKINIDFRDVAYFEPRVFELNKEIKAKTYEVDKNTILPKRTPLFLEVDNACSLRKELLKQLPESSKVPTLNIQAYHLKLSDDVSLGRLHQLSEQEPCLNIVGIDVEAFGVESPSYSFQPNDPNYHRQRQHSLIESGAAWSFFYDSKKGIREPRVTIAIVDTGMDLDHRDYRGRLWENSQGHHGYDFINLDTSPEDDHSHGTNVGGLAGSTMDDGFGTAGVAAKYAKLMSVKVLGGSDSSGRGTVSSLSNGIRWAVDNGADVINLSIQGGSTFIWGSSLQHAAENDVVVVLAAGNSSHDVGEHQSSASVAKELKGVIAVADVSASTGRLSSRSNFSPVYIEIAAPGSDGTCGPGIRNQPFQCKNGTSMAAPIVAGASALILGIAREHDIELSSEDVIAILKTSSDRSRVHLKTAVENGNLLNLKNIALHLIQNYPKIGFAAPEKPNLSVSPSSEVIAGSSVELTCEVPVANGDIYYSWKKDGNKITGAKGKQYTTQVNSPATFSCQAANLAGSIVSDVVAIQLLDTEAPKIISQPQSVTTNVGSEVTLKVGAEGPGTLVYQWICNGNELSGENSSQLTFANIGSNQAGDCRVRVSNSNGFVLSQTVTIKVISPPSILTGPVSINAVLGSRVSLNVSVGGVGPFSYQWFKNNQELEGATGQVLTFDPLKSSENGDYHIRVSNSAGSVTSQKAKLLVVVPLRITSQPQNIIVTEADNTRLQVMASGSPPITYQWKKDGQNIPGANSESLVLNSVKPSEGGLYSVTVKNPNNSVTSQQARVEVRFSPKVSLTPTQFKADISQRVVISANAVANPNLINYQWYWEHPITKQVELLRGETRSELILEDFQLNQRGFYFVRVQNSIGGSESEWAIVESNQIDRVPTSVPLGPLGNVIINRTGGFDAD